MLPLLLFPATLCTARFAGAILYINVAEHPARMRRDMRAALAQWAVSYKRATWLQAPLAVVGLVASLAAWHRERARGGSLLAS
jgi:predicted exporter